MAKHPLHFSGLKPGTHTWFYNRAGGQIRIDPGDWVLLDDEKNPWWPRWVESGEAVLAEHIPEGIDYLDEDSGPKSPPQIPRSEPVPRGLLNVLGPPATIYRITKGGRVPFSVDELTNRQLERVRLTYMPRELPGVVYHDGRLDRRAGRRASTLPPPFELNFLILIRLAWLRCRRAVELKLARDEAWWREYQQWAGSLDLPPEEPLKEGRAEVRDRIELSTAQVLWKWGVLSSPRLPHRTTIFRQLVHSGLDVADLDVAIMNTWAEISRKGTKK